MSLEVLPLQSSDFDILISHATTSYPGDDLVAPPNPVTWPVSTHPEAQTRLQYCMSMQKARFQKDPTCHFMKVVYTPPATTSTSPPEIIAVARWHRYCNGYDYAQEAHWELAAHPPGSPPDAEWPAAFNQKAHDFILTERDRFREAWIPRGEPTWILMHLVTRPSWRGRGAAGLLIRWGQGEAAREAACAYLEAGAAARPLYERYGFCTVGSLRSLDLRPVGLDLDFSLANMRWEPPEVDEEESNKYR